MKKKKSSESMRSAILREFDMHLYEKGFNKTTIKSIGRALNISTGHITYYFPKKEDLYIELSANLTSMTESLISDLAIIKLKPLEKVMLINKVLHDLFFRSHALQDVSEEVLSYPEINDRMCQYYIILYLGALKKERINIDENSFKLSFLCAWYDFWMGFHWMLNKRISISPEELSSMYFGKVLDASNLPAERRAFAANTFKTLGRIIDIDQLIEKIYSSNQYNHGLLSNIEDIAKRL